MRPADLATKPNPSFHTPPLPPSPFHAGVLNESCQKHTLHVTAPWQFHRHATSSSKTTHTMPKPSHLLPHSPKANQHKKYFDGAQGPRGVGRGGGGGGCKEGFAWGGGGRGRAHLKLEVLDGIAHADG